MTSTNDIASELPMVEQRQLPEVTRQRWWRQMRWLVPGAVLIGLISLVVLMLFGVFDAVPILNPAAAAAVEVSGGVLLALSWTTRQRSWWRRKLPAILLAAALVTGAVGLLLWITRTVTDAYPASFAIWVFLGLTAIFGVVPACITGNALRRSTALAAVLVTISGAVMLINGEYGLWPKIGTMLGHGDGYTAADLSAALHLPAGSVSSDHGVVAPLDVPSTKSGFQHRAGSIYLPPAYFGNSRNSLPVLVMLAGVPGAPSHWITAGHAVTTMDAYAKQHRGVAPIMIFIDQNGSTTGDTECVDGPQGMAETYLTVDLPNFVTGTLHVARNPARWGIVGFSAGGTCALLLTLRHTGIFRHLVTLAGDAKPTLGNAERTLRDLFGGSKTAQDAHDPALLFKSKKYSMVTAWFAAGESDKAKITVEKNLAASARTAGMTVYELIGAGGHNWQFASDAFTRILPQLTPELGLR